MTRPTSAILTTALALAWALAGCSGADAPPPPGITTPTPAPEVTRQVSGAVVDPQSAPVSGATLTTSRTTLTSDAYGGFSFRHPAYAEGHVVVEAEDYHPTSFSWATGIDPVKLRLVMRPRPVERPLTGTIYTLSPDDGPLYVGEPYESPYCRAPCRTIDLAGEPARVHLTWNGTVQMQMWAVGGSRINSANVLGPQHLAVTTIPDGDTRRIYVGGLSQRITEPFRFSLTLQ